MITKQNRSVKKKGFAYYSNDIDTISDRYYAVSAKGINTNTKGIFYTLNR